MILYSLALLWLLGAIIYWQKHRKTECLREQSTYVDEVIKDAKVSTLLDIPDTLREMANQQNVVVMEELKNRKVSRKVYSKLQKESQRRLNIKPNYSFPTLDDDKKTKLIVREIKKVGLSKNEFDESHVKFLLDIEWVLEKFDRGLSLKLENNAQYRILKNKLSTEIPKISSEEVIVAIQTYLDVCLGMNSLILYLSYFPKAILFQLPQQANKSITELRHDRDTVLDVLLQRIRKLIEDELSTKSGDTK